MGTKNYSTENIHDPVIVEYLYLNLLAKCFPPSELVSLGYLKWKMKTEKIQLIGVSNKNKKILGFSVLESFKNNVHLLLYICIDLEHRGEGLGKILFERTLKEAKKKNSRILFIEMEPEETPFTNEWFGDPIARLNFYRKLNVRKLDFFHYQAAVSSEYKNLELILGFIPLSPETNGERLSSSIVENFEKEYLEDPEYGIVSEFLKILPL